jgi:hypothetical protein
MDGGGQERQESEQGEEAEAVHRSNPGRHWKVWPQRSQ